MLDLNCNDSGEKNKVFKISLQIPVLKLLTLVQPMEMNFVFSLCKDRCRPQLQCDFEGKEQTTTEAEISKICKISNKLDRNPKSSYNKELKVFQEGLPYVKKSHVALQVS